MPDSSRLVALLTVVLGAWASASLGVVAQGEEGAVALRQAAAGRATRRQGGISGDSFAAQPSTSAARARAIGKSGPTDPSGRGRGGGGASDADAQQADGSGGGPRPQPGGSAQALTSAAGRRRQERLRIAGSKSGSGSSGTADYTYIPLDGRVLLRPRSLSKLRDYTLDVYGGINEIAQAQPFFAGASVAGRVGLASRYSVDYSDYLQPRQINSRIGPSAHVATVTTARAQGTAGFKAATDDVETRRASYRFDIADANLFEAGDVYQSLNARSAGATVERDQSNDPFYASVPDVGPGLVGGKKRRRRRRVE
jgi:hypothetical protein